MSDKDFRIERDSMGELQVPADALWGAQTQRAVENFPVSGLRMPRAFIRAVGLVKWAAARANRSLGCSRRTSKRHRTRCRHGVEGHYDDQFPDRRVPDRLRHQHQHERQRGDRASGQRAPRRPVHPNDHVNMGQSSNDVIPTAIHVSAALESASAAAGAAPSGETLEAKAAACADIVKTGRTHLMDAMPVTMAQELGGWAAQIRSGIDAIESVMPRLTRLAQGGTAVGTGINAHPEFGARFAAELSERTGVDFTPNPDYFESLSSQDAAVEVSGQLKTVAVSVMKIANDLRWMNSGPLAGLGEIALPALQPGSSIMPGKVNPVIPEAAPWSRPRSSVTTRRLRIAGQSGNFQLNVMLPVIAHNLLQSIDLLAAVPGCWPTAPSPVSRSTRIAAGRAGAQPDPGHRAQSGHRL